MRPLVDAVMRALIGPQFDAFGCPVRGMHVDNAEAAACLACRVERRTEKSEGPIELVDNRGPVAGLGMDSSTSWSHSRFFLDGALHRLNGPAIESEYLRAWFVDGDCHRDEGPSVEWGDDGQAWTRDGLFHREDGPALSWGTEFEWRVRGVLHRSDGPARCLADGTIQYFLNGVEVSRALAWAHFVAGFADIAADNVQALEWLDSQVNDRSEPDAPFLPLDCDLAAIAASMFSNLPTATEAESPAPEDLQQSIAPVAKVPTVFEAVDSHPLSPAMCLPVGRGRQDLPYDREEFARRIQQARRIGTLRRVNADLGTRWGQEPRNWPRSSAHSPIRADLELDPTMVSYGCRDAAAWRILSNQPRQEPPQGHGASELGLRRHRLCFEAQANAKVLAQTYERVGGFRHIEGALAPDDTITCVFERAFEFAAQAVALGVDDIAARSWATAMIVAAGYARVPFGWGGNRPVSGKDALVWPRRTLASEYYARSLEDLRERSDATAFMDIASRVSRWSSVSVITD